MKYMADKTITGIVTWLKGWFYDKTEVTGFLNNKANVSDLQTTNSNLTNLQGVVDNKVDKVTGKGLSTEDFTTTLKDKLEGVENGATKTVVDSALSGTSTNPVQNKAINTALEGKADSSHTHSSADVIEHTVLSNIGTGGNATQHAINTSINTKIGELSSIKAINVVTTLPTASSSTLGKLYIISESGSVNVYYTEQSGTGSSATYSWHKMDTDILDELSIDWSDIENKPSSYPPSSHAHGNITSTGQILGYNGEGFLVSNGDNDIVKQQTFPSTHMTNADALAFMELEADSTQAVINENIDLNLQDLYNNKGAKTDDIDWSYNSNNFVNGIKLVPKSTNDTGAITFHLKS